MSDEWLPERSRTRRPVVGEWLQSDRFAPTWMAEAACVDADLTEGLDFATLHRIENGRFGQGNFGMVKMMVGCFCKGCPVKSECLDYAMQTEDPKYRHGVYGGLSPNQRTWYAKGDQTEDRRSLAERHVHIGHARGWPLEDNRRA